MTAHRIRLRDFWAATPLPDGRTRYVRRFGRPRMSDSSETVWLVWDSLPDPAVVSVNDIVVGDGDATAVEVTGRLADRNEVAIEVAGHEPEDVAIEIRCQERSA